MKHNGWRARLLSILLVIAMVMSGASSVRAQEAQKTGYGMTVTLQIEAYDETIEQGVEVTMPDVYKTFADYGLTGVPEPEEEGYTMLHVMAQYCEDTYGEGTAASLIGVGDGGFVNGFLDLPRKSTIMFLKNHKSLDVGAHQEKVQEGDVLSVVDVWANSSWTIGGQYGWFEEAQMTAEAGNPFSVKLNVTPLMWGESGNAANATVKVVDKDGNVAAEGKTDRDGRVSLKVDKEGTYTVTAERKSDYYDNDGSHPWDLVTPHGTLTVTPGETLTDAEAVERAGTLLQNQLAEYVDINQIVGDFTLPATGNYGTNLTWTSSREDLIQIDGSQAKVTQPIGNDQQAVLKAVITRNTDNAGTEARAEKEIAVTVVGKALFTELSVDHGKLEYDKNRTSYTLYVKDDVEKLTVSGTAAEGVNVVSCGVIDEQGKAKEEKKITVLEPGFQAVTYLRVSDKEFTPQEVKLTAQGTTAGTVTITVKRGSPGEPLPDLPNITWGQHLGDKNNNAVTEAKTPVEEGELLWESFSNGQDSWGSVYAGTPILVDGSIYAVRDQKLERLDAGTGTVLASSKLHAGIGYYSNIIYGGGMIFVPLGDGTVQCFQAATLTPMYLLASPAWFGTSLSVNGAMHYDDGKIYIGYSDGAFVNPKGCYAAYDTIDLDVENETELVTPLWKTEDNGQSYYGAGAVTADDNVVIAGDSGIVSVREALSGKELSTCQLDGMVRGALVYADGYVWAATQGKKLYKLSVSAEGDARIVSEAELPGSTNASPAVVGGKLYITGGTFNDGGYLAVYDMNLKLLASEKTKNALNTPTVTTAYDDVYVYFTENGEAGSLYMAKVTANNQITVTKLYTPEHPQYSMSKVVAGADGTLYYGNDAGYLYAIKEKDAKEPEEPDDEGRNPDGDAGNPGEEDAGSTDYADGSGQNIRVSPEDFVPTAKKVKVNASGKNKESKESVSESIVRAIEKSSQKNEKTLTISQPPETIEAEVFAALAEHPQMQLILDCGTYTLSIRGSEVTDTTAALSTKLLELENNLSGEDAKKYGNYQRLALIQEGALPGAVTVVYQAGEQFEQSEKLYFYSMARPGEAEEVLYQKPYAMFTLEEAGEYILADQAVKDSEVKEPKVMAIEEPVIPEKGKEEKFPSWIYLLIGAGAGVLIGGVAAGKILTARKRKDTWEK